MILNSNYLEFIKYFDKIKLKIRKEIEKTT